MTEDYGDSKCVNYDCDYSMTDLPLTMIFDLAEEHAKETDHIVHVFKIYTEVRKENK